MAISTLSRLTVPLDSNASASNQGLLMPKLGSNIWYRRTDFDRRKEPDNLKVISAAEGFFKIEGEKCSFPYMW